MLKNAPPPQAVEWGGAGKPAGGPRFQSPVRPVTKSNNSRTTQAKSTREVYLWDGQPSAIEPITQTAQVPMDSGSRRELATFQVAKVPKYQGILGMP